MPSGDARRLAVYEVSDFTIGEPTEAPMHFHHQSKWSGLMEQVHALNNGFALPLEFADLQSATTFANGRATSFRRRGVRMTRRGTTVYLSKIERKS